MDEALRLAVRAFGRVPEGDANVVFVVDHEDRPGMSEESAEEVASECHLVMVHFKAPLLRPLALARLTYYRGILGRV